MKRLTLILATLLLFCLAGCETGPSEPTSSIIEEDLQYQSTEYHTQSEPDSNMIEKDLQHKLNEYRTQAESYALDIIQFEVVKSLSEEKTYTAQFNVIAQSQYANLYYVADIAYALYDQGWFIDSCQWEMQGYEVVTYPSETDIPFLPEGDIVAYWDNIDQSCTGDMFYITGTQTSNWGEYATSSENSTISWTYNIVTDQWDYADTQKNSFSYSLTPDFWTVWLESNTTPGIQFTNLSETGFDIELEDSNIKMDSFHVEYSDGYVSSNANEMCLKFTNTDINFYIKDRNCNNDGHLTVYFFFYNKPFKNYEGYWFDMRCDYGIINRGTLGYDAYSNIYYHTIDIS